jgi:hypothetical protein
MGFRPPDWYRQTVAGVQGPSQPGPGKQWKSRAFQAKPKKCRPERFLFETRFHFSLKRVGE